MKRITIALCVIFFAALSISAYAAHGYGGGHFGGGHAGSYAYGGGYGPAYHPYYVPRPMVVTCWSRDGYGGWYRFPCRPPSQQYIEKSPSATVPPPPPQAVPPAPKVPAQ